MKRRWPWSLGTSRWSALLALAAALGLLAAVACGSETDDAAEPVAEESGATTAVTDAAAVTEPEVTIGHEVGMQAPDFTVETVAGESFTLSDVNAAGSPVLLYFFATW